MANALYDKGRAAFGNGGINWPSDKDIYLGGGVGTLRVTAYVI